MIENIHRFLIIVKQKSLTKAAQSLHMTQPALSLAMKRLEMATQKKIFIRTGKYFTLTEEGKVMYRIGERVMELWEHAKSPYRYEQSIPVISLGLFDNAALRLAPFFQKYFAKKQHNIEMKIDNSFQLLQDLHYGILDICICVFDLQTIIPQNTHLLQKSSEQLIPVSAKKIMGNSVHKIPFILYKTGSSTRNCIDETFFQHTIQPHVVAESTSTTFMKELALTGSGVALLPKNVVTDEIKQKKLFVQKLPFSFSREIGILIRKDGVITPDDVLIKKIGSYFK